MSVPMPPAPGEWTADEYDALPADGYRRELIGGVLHVAAPPAGRHQRVVANLAPRSTATAPGRSTSRTVWCSLWRSCRTPRVAMGRVLKPNRYAAAGIAHYWRVELDDEPRVFAYETDFAGGYLATDEFQRKFAVTRPWPMEIDLDRLPR